MKVNQSLTTARRLQNRDTAEREAERSAAVSPSTSRSSRALAGVWKQIPCLPRFDRPAAGASHTAALRGPQLNWVLSVAHLKSVPWPGFSVVFLLLSLLLTMAPSALAQANNLKQLSLAATSYGDAQGRQWAWLLWQQVDAPIDPARMVAVYSKPGDANSTDLYQRQAIIGLQVDPVTIQPLLNRAANVGQSLVELEATTDTLFEGLMPAGTITLPQKLSAVIQGSLGDPNHLQNLLLLARRHPGVAMCLGFAHAQQIPGPVGTKTTFELRLYDMTSDQDLGVIGRVTATAGQPTVLPAPGQPVEVPDITAQGHLSVRMRWATPDPLRRLSLLQVGYNVYRMTRAFAEANNYDAVPPATATLLSLANANPNVHRLNNAPVIAEPDFSVVDVNDFVNFPTLRFFADDNDRFNPASVLPQAIYTNGAQFYYFVTARDLLGRDGLVSRGTPVTVCDRLPPQPPRSVRVANHYAYNGNTETSDQRLRVNWNQNDNSGTETTTAYYIYRWTSITQMHAHAADFNFNRIAGPIAHLPGSPTNSYLDNGPGAPHITTDAGRTFWYTVIAVDAGVCAPGANRSLHSAPAFGVLRDRTGPERGGGRITIACTRPVVEFVPPTSLIPNSSPNTNFHRYRLVCRVPGDAAWVQFRTESLQFGNTPAWTAAGGKYLLLKPQAADYDVRFEVLIATTNVGTGNPAVFFCRFGAGNGKVSNEASSGAVIHPSNAQQIRQVNFLADMQTTSTVAGRACDTHDPTPPDGSGGVSNICVTAFLTASTREYRLYRRVDGGSLTMWSQGEAAFPALTQVQCCDDGMPANGAEICYYVQLLDEHGNAGPMERVGCVQTAPKNPLPTPMLKPLVALGTSTNALMGIEWFCPAPGVERFEVWIGGNPHAPALNPSPFLVSTNSTEFGLAFELPGPDDEPQFISYRTPRLGPRFGAGPMFGAPSRILLGNTYTVLVRAVGKDGSLGPFSNAEQFIWNTTNAPVINVPWPDRTLPPITVTNFPGLLARVFTTNSFPTLRRFEGLGVRIGQVGPLSQTPQPNSPDFVPGNTDPVQRLYTHARTGESLFPAALYRFQVANDAFPDVSGDVTQVTPLMEQIAYEQAVVPGVGNSTVIHDPFIRVFPDNSPTPLSGPRGIYLLDTQPVIVGARYRYVLVRFAARSMEIAEVIPTNEVEVTP